MNNHNNTCCTKPTTVTIVASIETNTSAPQSKNEYRYTKTQSTTTTALVINYTVTCLFFPLLATIKISECMS